MGRTVELKIPEGIEPSRVDLELLKAALQAVVTLRYERSREWEKIIGALESDGWKVQWRLHWQAEARRGDESEVASGATLDQAFAELQQLVRLDEVCHCP